MLTIPNYKVSATLYKDARTSVYRARRLSDDHSVTLKVISPNIFVPGDGIKFKKEFNHLSRLQIPGILNYLDMELINIDGHDLIIMVLDDFKGISLKKFVEKNGFPGPGNFLKICGELAGILWDIHRNDITHGNLNLTGIIVHEETRKIKITNFSFSRNIGLEREILNDKDYIRDILPYISPEQTGRMNRPVDYRTDMYSLGIIFYYLLTKKIPFYSEDPMEMFHSHIARIPDAPADLNPSIPRTLSDITMKLLSKTAELRYQSAYNLRKDLEECLRQWEENRQINLIPGENDISEKFHIPLKLYGRENDINKLLGAYERVRNSASCEVVLVSGSPGIGKTSLIKELNKPIIRDRGFFISSRFSQNVTEPAQGLLYAAGELVRKLLTENEDRLRIWKPELKKNLGENAAVLLRYIPDIELIIGPREFSPEETEDIVSEQNLTAGLISLFRTFSSRSHPLILFLDDLQFADTLGLDILYRILAEESNAHFLLICSTPADLTEYDSPPLIFLNRLGTRDIPINVIKLKDLSLEDLNQLISETLHTTPEKSSSLSELIYQKTTGNPLFARQFIQSLYENKMFHFDPLKGWLWEMENISGLSISANMAEIIATKITRQPPQAQELLQLASCIGNKFDITTLAKLTNLSSEKVWDDLSGSVLDGILEISNDSCKFSHNRIKDSIYNMIPEERKYNLHYLIGNYLLSSLLESDKKIENPLHPTDQLNASGPLINSPEERKRLMALNIDAGIISLKSFSVSIARKYFLRAAELLEYDDSRENRRQSYIIYLNLCGCEYNLGNFRPAKKYFKIAFQFARPGRERAELYNMQTMAYSRAGKTHISLKSSRAALKEMGVRLPAAPGKLRTLLAYLKLKLVIALKRNRIEDFLYQVKSKNRDHEYVMEIMFNLLEPGYQTVTSVRNYNIIKMAGYAISKGANKYSSPAFLAYGILLGSIQNDYNTAYRYGSTALNIIETRFDNPELTARCYIIFAAFISPWKRPLKESLVLLEKTYPILKENKDSLYLDLCRGLTLWLLDQKGESLEIIEGRINQEVINSQANNVNSMSFGNMYGDIYREIIETLKSGAPPPPRGKSSYNHKNYPNITVNHWYYLVRIKIHYFLEDFEGAYAAGKKCDELFRRGAATNLPQESEGIFYYTLSITALINSQNGKKRKELEKTLKRNIKIFNKWARSSPENFGQKYLLLKGEYERIKGNLKEALKHYDRSIKTIKEGEFIPVKALACEFAGKLTNEPGREILTGAYIRTAYFSYLKWGALSRARKLEKDFSRAFQKIEKRESKPSVQDGGNDDELDLGTVIKASQTISGEIVLNSLLDNLMSILLENAGARKGFLIQEWGKTMFIEARGKLGESPYKQERTVLENSELAPLSLINYVKRTHKSVVINNAPQSEMFKNDPYIIRNKPASLLCMPVMKQKKLIGILYLENDLTLDAFTEDRLEILNLLSSQAAISLENARLYDEMNQLNRGLLREVEQRKQAEERAEVFSAELEEFSYTVSHDLRAPIRAVQGFAGAILNDYGERLNLDMKTLLKKIQSRGHNMGLLIDGLLGFIRIGRKELNITNLNMTELARSAMEHRQIKDYDAEPFIEILNMPDSRGDRAMIHQVFEELLTNAVKYTSPIENPYIEIGCSVGAENVYYVKDNGVGFDIQNTNKVFAIFQTLHDESKFDGAGVGLAMANRIIQRHDGKIWARAENGGGAIFYFTLGARS